MMTHARFVETLPCQSKNMRLRARVLGLSVSGCRVLGFRVLGF